MTLIFLKFILDFGLFIEFSVQNLKEKSKIGFTIASRFTIIEHESLHYCETLLYSVDLMLFNFIFSQ